MEYVDRPSPPSPALYLQCYNLFAVESRSEKKKEERMEKRQGTKGMSDKTEPGNSRRKGEREE